MCEKQPEKKRRWLIYLPGAIILVLVAGFIVPERLIIPVQGASTADWNHETFWYEPWGKSGVHKGIDIFADKGTPLLSATDGIVIFAGEQGRGGTVIAVLGPRWRIHYYAHLETFDVSLCQPVRSSQAIGTVGDSGNAKGTPPHLHYSVLTMVPYPWRWDSSTQGWKKTFILDPGEMLLNNE